MEPSVSTNEDRVFQAEDVPPENHSTKPLCNGETNGPRERPTRKEKIMITNVSNLIDYVRIGISLLSCLLWFVHPVVVVLLFIIGKLILGNISLSIVYGSNQRSIYSDVLHQITDSCTVVMFLMGLSIFYPHYSIFFQLTVFFEVMGVWLCTISNILQIRSGISFNINFASSNVADFLQLLWICSRTCRCGSEIYYMMLYLSHFSNGRTGLMMSIVGFCGDCWSVIVALMVPVYVVMVIAQVVVLLYHIRNVTALDHMYRNHPKLLKKLS